jgi:hypothetical protein
MDDKGTDANQGSVCGATIEDKSAHLEDVSLEGSSDRKEDTKKEGTEVGEPDLHARMCFLFSEMV